MTCLGIPIPSCVRELLLEPPICFPIGEDAKILDLIKELGREFKRPQDEINQACNLASGPSDLIVILERPYERQEYDVAFDQFVRECPTLKALDELIRFGSKGARSIHTVTVLDAFSFTPNKSDSKSAPRCHQLIEDILHLKKPRVIVRCWTGQCDNAFVSRFKSQGVGTWPLRDTVEIGTRNSTLVRSFHPSTVLHFRKRSPYSRMLLICHFVLAFAELSETKEHPGWIKEVCHESSKLVTPRFLAHLILRGEFRERNDKALDEEEIRHIILSLLQRITAEKPRRQPGTVPGSILVSRERDDVNYLLRWLFTSNYSRGAVDVTHLCLTWEHYSHPRKDDVLFRFREIGSRQRWFLPESGPDPPIDPLIRFDDEKSDLEQGLGSLTINNSFAGPANIIQAHIDEQNALLRTLGRVSSRRKLCLEEFEQTAVTLSARVHTNANLQINASSVDRIELSSSIAELAQGMYDALVQTSSLVAATRTLLVGDDGLSREEDLPEGSMLRRRDSRTILCQLIADIEPLVGTGFRCALLLSGLVAQGKLLFPRAANLTDSLEALLKLPPDDLTKLADKLHHGLTTLLALREQADGGETMVSVEYPTPPFP